MMSIRQWVAMLAFYALYLLAGAFVFQSLEQENERENLNKLITLQGTLSYVIHHVKDAETKNELILAIKNFERHLDEEMFLPKNYKHFLHSHMKQLEEQEENGTLLMSNVEDVSLNERGSGIMGHVLSNGSVEEGIFEKNSMWTLWNSFYFSFTAITTIGFGHMYPSTSGGQFFCILYSIVGVPLNGILFSGLEGIYSARMIGALDAGVLRSKRKILLYATLYLMPGLMIFMVFPAVVFMLMEGWSFLEGFYFAFITITTIGFGDYVAGYSTYEGQYTLLYRIGIYIWIVFGLGYFLMMANFVQKLLRSNDVRRIDRKVKSLITQSATLEIEKNGEDIRRLKSCESCVQIVEINGDHRNCQLNNVSSEREKQVDVEKNEKILQNGTDLGKYNSGFEDSEQHFQEAEESKIGSDMNKNLESGTVEILQRSSSLSSISTSRSSDDECHRRCSLKSISKNKCIKPTQS